MQKLVSKNPIQRFKQGKKILKGQWGIDLAYIDNPSVMTAAGHGPKISDIHIPTKQERQLGNNLAAIGMAGATGTSGNLLATKTNVGSKILQALPEESFTTFPELDGAILGTAVAAPFIYASRGSNEEKKLNNKEIIPLGGIQKLVSDHEHNIALSRMKNSKPKQSSKTSTVTTKSKVIAKQPVNNSMFLAKQGGWNKNIGLGNINDQESKDILNKLGWKDKTAKQVQQLLNSNNIGGYAVNVDNKWGNQSKDALKKYYERYLKEQQINPPTDPVAINLDQAYQAQKPSNQPSVTPKIEMPYTSTGTYNLDNSRTLKTLGIKDYNSLLNFIERNPGSSIASDLKQRFGETSGWNQQNIENEIGIGGHYGRMNRNALWGYLNGLKQKYNSLTPQKLGWMALRKQGGQLVSRNPVKRFKNKKK